MIGVIITKEATIKVTKNNKLHLENFGYCVFIGEILTIDVNHLTNGSHYLIEVCCDVCGKIRTMLYKHYIRNFNKYNLYTCNTKCAHIKNKLTCIEKYGVESYSKTSEFITRFEDTCLKKFGTKTPLSSEIIKEKIKNTCIEKYGVDHNTKSEIVINNRKINSKLKYGVEHTTQLDSVKNSIKESVKEKYGVENVTQVDSIKEKNKKFLY